MSQEDQINQMGRLVEIFSRRITKIVMQAQKLIFRITRMMNMARLMSMTSLLVQARTKRTFLVRMSMWMDLGLMTKASIFLLPMATQFRSKTSIRAEVLRMPVACISLKISLKSRTCVARPTTH